jgi:hypothetical protein
VSCRSADGAAAVSCESSSGELREYRWSSSGGELQEYKWSSSGGELQEYKKSNNGGGELQECG